MSAAFRPGWALTLQVAAALATVLALAGWQVSRALEKTALRDARLQKLGTEPASASTVSPARIEHFTRLALIGHYDAERQFLVVDRLGGRPLVVTPFATVDGVFLVNRGRAPLLDRAPPAPGEQVAVVGVVWPAKPLAPALAQTPWPEDWPKQVRALQPERMAAALKRDGSTAHAVEIRLEAGNPGVLQAASVAWDYSPGTHWGYVVQWLLIGAAIGIGYVAIGKRRARTGSDDG